VSFLNSCKLAGLDQQKLEAAVESVPVAIRIEQRQKMQRADVFWRDKGPI
jgi:hypothetical protein